MAYYCGAGQRTYPDPSCSNAGRVLPAPTQVGPGRVTRVGPIYHPYLFLFFFKLPSIARLNRHIFFSYIKT